MTKTTKSDTPEPAAAPESPAAEPAQAAKVAADLIEADSASAGSKAPTAAADAAHNLVAAAGGGDPAPAATEPPAAPIGRSTPRAQAGFSVHRSKAELVKRGRALAEEAERMRQELAAIKGTTVGEGGEAGELVPVVQMDPATMIAPLTEAARFIFGFLASWRGPHWNPTDEQLTKMATACAEPAAQQLPVVFARHAGLIAAGFTVANVVLPMLQKDRELAAQQPAGAS